MALRAPVAVASAAVAAAVQVVATSVAALRAAATTVVATAAGVKPQRFVFALLRLLMQQWQALR